MRIELILFPFVLPMIALGQGVTLNSPIQTTSTSAIISYTTNLRSAYTIQVADMNRGLTIVSGTGNLTTVTLTLSITHGLSTGSIIYVENSGISQWNGWQTIASVPTTTSLTFANVSGGTSTGGNIGVLADDVNPNLFTNSNSDLLRPTSIIGLNKFSRTVVIGQKDYAPIANDGNGHVRGLHANSRYKWTLTDAGGFPFNGPDFTTQSVPVGDTHNNGVPVDRSVPGRYALQTIAWNNIATPITDPDNGINAVIASPLADVASSSQSFVSAPNPGSGWSNATGPLASGSATQTGAGSVGNALFLRADGFVISGGPTYDRDTGNSFDWLKIAYTGVSSSAGGQSMITCITVNGVNCPTISQKTTPITTTPSPYLVGSGTLMDCLQSAGPCPFSSVDVSTVTGTGSYVSGTGVLTFVSGFPFSLKWISGSLITVGSTVCTIGSVQSELQITLSSCPAVTTGSYSYTANNFGILTWCTGSCTIGPTTYTFGTAPMQLLNTSGTAEYPSGPIVTVGGIQGQYSFINDEIMFYPANGGPAVDKGQLHGGFGFGPDGSTAYGSSQPYAWDPVIPGAMYFGVVYFGGPVHIVQLQLTNDTGQAGTPNTPIPTCPQTGLCITPTQMTTSDIYTEITTFNANCLNFPFSVGNSPQGIFGIGGIYVAAGIYTSQDHFGCVAAYTLGTDIPRTPEGTDAGSLALIAAMPTWSQPCATWCNIHAPLGASSGSPGWLGWASSTQIGPASEIFTATLTSSTQLSLTLIPCPTNPFGVPTSGNLCSAITTTGDPVNSSAATLQHIQVGDVMSVDHSTIVEYLRVLQCTNSPCTSLTVQRGYFGGTIYNHTNTTLSMACGGTVAEALINAGEAGFPLWNFLADPLGANSSYTTIVPALYSPGTHGNIGLANQSYTVQAGGSNQPTSTLCPNIAGYCNLVWLGDYATAFLTQTQATIVVSEAPQFAGISPTIGTPNVVDTHAGPAIANWVMDGRPFVGGINQVCSFANPFTNTTGFLWKCAAANISPAPNRKLVSTAAYVGRSALVDVSGPGSVISGTSADNYKYCYANAVGECVGGSTIGDVYVNAPYVSFPYCFNPNVNSDLQTDDTNMICIGDLGAYAENVTQQGVSTNDVVGATGRALGSAHNIYNQQYVFWISNNIPSGLASTNYIRWGDQLASAITTNLLPPFPLPDGVNRSTFIPVPIQVTGPANLSTAQVQFWYSDGGGIGCTSRQEVCIANAATVTQATPFAFPSESPSKLTCSGGCTISLAALSGRVVLYQILEYDSGGNLILTGPVQATVTP